MVKVRHMVDRRYLVTVFTEDGEVEYVERTGDNKNIVLGDAYREFGFMNVAGVYVDDRAGKSREWLRLRGINARLEDEGVS